MLGRRRRRRRRVSQVHCMLRPRRILVLERAARCYRPLEYRIKSVVELAIIAIASPLIRSMDDLDQVAKYMGCIQYLLCLHTFSSCNNHKVTFCSETDHQTYFPKEPMQTSGAHIDVAYGSQIGAPDRPSVYHQSASPTFPRLRPPINPESRWPVLNSTIVRTPFAMLVNDKP
ncbi:hypothetical protein FB45DRAFT_448994 [Roridomyces roridus]|uniref:Uncharacterized protein n=1 Tax=Roridomyces roridus TaxID=1738132 RepID=A0AAD7FQ59_9AGAR|nr:hypothetical protein FB45DRAFT_448994 [Roridomyces roridus]